MPLRPATKSVLFYKGMTDDTDRFLAKSPAIQYSENLYEEKSGTYSKRPGFESLGSPTDAFSGSPFMLHGVGDSLYTMSADKGHVYRDGAWGEVENNGDITPMAAEVLVRTHPKFGARDFTFCFNVIGGELKHYVIAFGTKTREEFALSVQTYALDGTLVGESRIVGARDPQLYGRDAGNANLFYVDDASGDLVRRLFLPATNSLGTVDTIKTAIDTEGNWTQRRRYPYVNLFEVAIENEHRIGLAHHRFEHKNAPYHIHYADGLLNGVALYKTRTTGPDTEDMWILELDQNGAPVGLPLRITGAGDEGIGSIDDSWLNPLDVVLDLTNNQALVLWAERYQATGTPGPKGVPAAEYFQRVRLAQINRPFTSVTNAVTVRELSQNEVFSNLSYQGHGSLVLNSGLATKVLVAYHQAPCEVLTHPDQFFGTRFSTPANSESTLLAYEERDVLTLNKTALEGTLLGVRLASRLVAKDGQYHGVVQQWGAYSPPPLHDYAPWVQNTIIPPQTKPVTSTLVRFLADSKVSVLAAMGAGASRCVNPSSEETTPRLPDLLLRDGEFHFANRQILQQEDLNYFVHDDQSVGWNTEARSSLSPPEALSTFWKVGGIGTRDIPTASFGNAAFVGAALPLWLTRGVMTEAFPLDRPEIDSAQLGAAEYITYWENAGPIEGTGPPVVSTGAVWRKFQVVVGYTDAAGVVHRSAPSNTLWAVGADNSNTDPNGILYVTPPISAFSGRRDYFAELYASATASGNLHLVATKRFEVSGTPSWDDFKIEFDIYADPNNDENYVQARSSEVIYTTRALPNIPWPSVKDMAVASRRLWVISNEYTGSVFYSKLFEENVAPELAGEFVIPLGEERDLTAIGVLDDKAVVFEKNDIHIIYGEGPNNLGRGTDFAVEYLETGAIGCEQPKSVVETPIGLMFYVEQRGFYMLDRNRQLQYVGAGVKDLSRGIVVHNATVDPREAEVRFLVSAAAPVDSDGPDAGTSAVDRPPRPFFGNKLPADSCLSYNYESGIWALYTNYRGTAATLYQNRYTRAFLDDQSPTAQWQVWKESGAVWSDPTGTNRTLLRSNWIELGSQVQDYQRLWRITLLGRYLSSLQDLGGGVYEAGDLIVRLRFDYEEIVAQEERHYFQDWGFDPFETPRRRMERFQCKIEPCRGRAQSVQIEIEEVQSEDRGEGLTYGLGRGFEIVSADFEIGVGDTPQSTRMISEGVRR